MTLNSGALPLDTYGHIASGVYAPGFGVVPIQGGTPTADANANANSQLSAPVVTQSRLSDANGNAFGTTANPIATNQLVGTPINNSATAAAGAQCQAILPAVAGKTTYINGLVISTHSPGANVTGVATVSLDGGTTNALQMTICESSVNGSFVTLAFADPLPATGQNITIKVTLPVIASGAVSAVSAWGYQL